MKCKIYNAIFLLGVLSFCPQKLIAQVPKWQIGIEGGSQWSKFSGSLNSALNESRFNANLGILAIYRVSKWFAINASLNYQGKGSRSNKQTILYDPITGDISSVGRFKFNYDYLTLPILLQFSYGNRLKYSIAMGGFIGYRYYVHRYFSTNNNSSVDLNSYTANNPKLDYGFTFMLGVSYPINKKMAISSFLKEDYGIRNISKDANYKLRTQAISFNFGLTYQL